MTKKMTDEEAEKELESLKKTTPKDGILDDSELDVSRFYKDVKTDVKN